MVTYEDILRYLNSEMPDIGGIFSAPVEPDDDGESAIPDQPVPPGLTPEQLALLYGRGDGDDRQPGGGAFGNLDLSKSKTVYRDVYDEEVGDFVPTELQAYLEPKSGLYKTFGGKNVDGMFTGNQFGIASFLGNTFGPQKIGGYTPGKIRGKFDTVGDLFGRNRNTYPNKMDIPANIMKRKKGYDVLNNTYQEILSTRDGPGTDNRDGTGGYSGGFDASTNNYNDPYDNDTE